MLLGPPCSFNFSKIFRGLRPLAPTRGRTPRPLGGLCPQTPAVTRSAVVRASRSSPPLQNPCLRPCRRPSIPCGRLGRHPAESARPHQKSAENSTRQTNSRPSWTLPSPTRHRQTPPSPSQTPAGLHQSLPTSTDSAGRPLTLRKALPQTPSVKSAKTLPDSEKRLPKNPLSVEKCFGRHISPLQKKLSATLWPTIIYLIPGGFFCLLQIKLSAGFC